MRTSGSSIDTTLGALLPSSSTLIMLSLGLLMSISVDDRGTADGTRGKSLWCKAGELRQSTVECSVGPL